MFRSRKILIPPIKLNLNLRLLLYVAVILVLACIAVGVPSYLIAQKELDRKGEVILQNAVDMAIMMLEAKNEQVRAGQITLEEAQEQAKVDLLGPMLSDGKRQNLQNVKLGKNGYFIVYSLDGIELMHPTLEGQNVWLVKDKNDDSRYLVQEQIDIAKGGGGFMTYWWNFPDSERLGEKISYSRIFYQWKWVVVVTAYKEDFNKGANGILSVGLISSVLLIVIGSALSLHFIKGITKPIKRLENAMKHAEEGSFQVMPVLKRNDEIGQLVFGYNSMVDSLNSSNSEIKDREQKLQYYAYFDGLSGLPNGNLLSETVEGYIKNGGTHGFFVLIDMKDFKTINSLYGANYGNQLIQRFSQLLSEMEEPCATWARINGNEFGCWLADCEKDVFIKMMSDLKLRIANAVVQDKLDIKLDFYTAYVAYPEEATSYDECYQKANVAMQYAKLNDVGVLTKYDVSMYNDIEHEALIRKYAHVGLAEGEFLLYYQSKVDCRTGQVVGVEALSRWFSKELGNVSPGIFLPIFRRSNLMIEFSEYVVRKALDSFPALQKKYHEALTLSINISPLFFFKDHFVSFIIQEIAARHIHPHQIILEITEDTLIKDPELLNLKVKELRAYGVKISLDDFGTGYSSLNYLRNIALDELKIDKSFIDFLSQDPKAASLFKSIVQIANTFDYQVIAEGVETEEQVHLVSSAGCHIIQGYHYSRPEPIE